MRILGLDFGSKTIGVAICDPLMITAQGLEIIRRQDENNLVSSIKRLEEIINYYQVEVIVLGYPKNLDNTDGIRAKKTIAFKKRLKKTFGLKVIMVDERFSTNGASNPLICAGLNSKKRKEVVDKQAAIFILQGYLDKINDGKDEENARK